MAIIRQIAGRYKHQLKAECLGVMDGDQSDSLNQHIGHFIKALEISKERDHEIEWFKNRMAFLPGNTWPEKWMIKKLKSLDISSFAKICGTTNEKLTSYLDEALSAEKHNELHILAKKLSLDSENVCCMVARWITENAPEDFYHLKETIIALLP